MSHENSILNNVRVASPCPASWERMEGDEQVRFCALCRLNVYNLSGMSRQEAEELIRQKQGRLCVRFYQRSDGTMLTQDCPVGLQAIRKRVATLVTGAFALWLGLISLAALWGRRPDSGVAGIPSQETLLQRAERTEPLHRILAWIYPTRATATMGAPVAPPVTPTMGAVAPIRHNLPLMGEIVVTSSNVRNSTGDSHHVKP